MKVSIKTALVIFGILGVLLIAGISYLRILFPPPLSKEATERDFIKNFENIIIVSNYLINSKHAEMSTNDNSEGGVMFVGLDGRVSIDDPKVTDAFNTLFENGYSYINKNKNTIHFQRSTRFMDFGSGMVYSIDGSKPRLEHLTRLEPLSEKNWYYYEEDFNEWKRRNTE